MCQYLVDNDAEVDAVASVDPKGSPDPRGMSLIPPTEEMYTLTENFVAVGSVLDVQPFPHNCRCDDITATKLSTVQMLLAAGVDPTIPITAKSGGGFLNFAEEITKFGDLISQARVSLV
jgi:hypothetical protein